MFRIIGWDFNEASWFFSIWYSLFTPELILWYARGFRKRWQNLLKRDIDKNLMTVWWKTTKQIYFLIILFKSVQPKRWYFFFLSKKMQIVFIHRYIINTCATISISRSLLIFLLLWYFLRELFKNLLFFRRRCCVVDTLEWQWMLKLYNILRLRIFFPF